MIAYDPKLTHEIRAITCEKKKPRTPQTTIKMLKIIQKTRAGSCLTSTTIIWYNSSATTKPKRQDNIMEVEIGHLFMRKPAPPPTSTQPPMTSHKIIVFICKS